MLHYCLVAKTFMPSQIYKKHTTAIHTQNMLECIANQSFDTKMKTACNNRDSQMRT